MPPDTRPAALPLRAQIRLVIGAAVGVAVVLALFHLIPALFGPRPAPAPPPLPSGYFRPTDDQWRSLTVARVEAMPFSDAVETDGKIAFDDDATTPVFSPYSGRVTRVFARAGQTVAPGDPLFAIDASEFVQAQNDFVAALAGLDTARRQLALAQANAEREEGLYAAKAAALKDLQQSRVDLIAAQGGLQTAQIALTAVRSRLRILGRSDAEIDAMANSGDWNPEAVVRAPVAGAVTLRQIGAGQNIVSAAAGGATPVFAIADTSKVWLVAYVREADAPAMRPGEAVEARVTALPGRVFRGRLDFVAAGIDPALHRLPVHAEIANPDGVLKPEMFASLRIFVGPERISPAVPQEAVIYEGAEARVWVVGPGRTLGLRLIRTGRTQGAMVEALAGVSAGDSVISGGSLFIDRAATAE